jgi:hypothetical protein
MEDVDFFRQKLTFLTTVRYRRQLLKNYFSTYGKVRTVVKVFYKGGTILCQTLATATNQMYKHHMATCPFP